MTPDELAMFIRKYIILYMQAKIVTDENPKLTIVSPDSLSFHHSIVIIRSRMGLHHMSFSCSAMPFPLAPCLHAIF